MRRAVEGARPSRPLIAALVRLRARSSSTWPSSTSVDDHRRRLEVDGDLIAVAAERRREQPGRQRRDHAEAERRPDAERDQREHVQVAVHHRRPAADEERPAAPQHDRRGQRELRPGHRRRRHDVLQRLPRQDVRDHEGEDRQRERERDAEAPRHVVELGVALVVQADRHRLERHAALRTRAGTDLADLRIHRARVLARVRTGRSGRRGRRRQERLRRGAEPLEAALVAEVVGVPAVLDMADRVGRRDRHAADRVDDLGFDPGSGRGLGRRGGSGRHAYFTYCCGLASNFVLQTFAQK